jgi:hypothetical protein
MFDSKRSSLLLILAFLLACNTGCSSSFRKTSGPQAAASSPLSSKIFHDKTGTIPSVDARVTKLVFFGSGPSDIAPLANPVYKNRFEHRTTARIHPEIHLEYPPPGRKTYFTMTVHIRQTGKTVRIVDYDSRIESEWTSSHHSVDVGVLGSGNWRVGMYDVDIHINGEKVATGAFEIY